MIVAKFRSVGWVAGVAVAALGCYLVSQRVAAERSELVKVERKLLNARRDIRQLQVEVQTRARLPQLEEWNAQVLALSAPSANQFLDSAVRLASLNEPREKALPLDPAVTGPRPEVRLASAEASRAIVIEREAPRAAPAPAPEQPLLRQATYVKPAGEQLASARATQVSLLDDGLLGDIGRLAVAERGGAAKRAR